MTIMRLPTKWSLSRDRAVRGSGPLWSPETNNTDRPGEELLDLYGVILSAVPLAFFLKWLWP